MSCANWLLSVPKSSPFNNILRPRQNGCHIFDFIFVKEYCCNFVDISLEYRPKAPTYNKLALVPIMVSRRAGDNTSSEPMMVLVYWRIWYTFSVSVAWWQTDDKASLELRVTNISPSYIVTTGIAILFHYSNMHHLLYRVSLCWIKRWVLKSPRPNSTCMRQ